MQVFQGGGVWVAGARRWGALPLFLVLLSLVLGGLVSGCGGGSGSVTATSLSLMRDSFGVQVAEADFGLGSLTASGVDGTVSGDVVIANALVKVIDNAGNSVVGKTDALGYYRVRVDGFVPPLIASVTRADGQVHFAATNAAIKVRGFVTLNITTLTDKLASDVAVAAGYSGAAQLPPRAIAVNPAVLETARVNFNAQWATLLKDNGLDAAFDPVSKAFKSDGTGYAKVMANFLWSIATNGSTLLTPRLSVGGNIVGLGARTGLTLVNGTETLAIAAQSTTFLFTGRVAQNAAYNVTVGSQPTGTTCGIASGTGVMNVAAVNNVLVLCNAVTNTVGGSIVGLGNSTGLVLGSGGLTQAIAANALGFVFSTPVPLGATYTVYVATQPVGKTCGVTNGTGIQQGNGPITNLVVSCTLNSYALGGTVTGLTTKGLVLIAGDQTVAVGAFTSAFEFQKKVLYGSAYTVALYAQPVGQTCSVGNASGTVGAADITNVTVTCVTNGYALGGIISGLTSTGLVLGSNGQTLAVSSTATTFEFALPIAFGTLYNVVVLAQPTGQTCTVTAPTGTLAASNLSAVSVGCVTTPP